MKSESAHKAKHVVRVMLVDDSIVARAILERIIETEAGLSVVASCASAAEAIDTLAAAVPDVILLDIDMPEMCGLTALPLILGKAHGARVLILSANCEAGGPAAIEALARGAADTMLKPGRGAFAGTFGQTLVERIHALSAEDQKPRKGWPGQAPSTPRPLVRHGPARAIAAIGIGASTGGIMAINAFLGALPRAQDCPIFITQHLPAGFMPYFADQLSRLLARQVLLAGDGMVAEPGTIYLAPGEGHLSLSRHGRRAVIMIDRNPSTSGATPSVDPMFAAIATVYGKNACGIMLSGMGRDGLLGARRLRAAGALILVQDLESCVVWGMPGAIANEGLADAVQNPVNLAEIVGSMAGTIARDAA
ncbi:MAG: chemotaxis-specific protein-glutamate methyltransferase CheB [Sphingopyxis sp.]